MSDRTGAPLRLLFAVPYSPRLDLAHGGRVVAQLLVRLAERHRIAVVYLRAPGSAPIDSRLRERCEFAEEITPGDGAAIGPDWRRRINVVAGPLSGVPSQVGGIPHRRLAQACVDAARQWGPDVVQVEHDVISDCGLSLQADGSTAARVLTCHEPGAPASEDQARVTRGRQRLAHRLDALAWRRYWSRGLPAFDAIVTLTDRDRAVMEAAVTGPRVLTIGLGIDFPAEPLSAIGRNQPSVLFIGSYQHPPNADAALRLVRDIMPVVRRRVPGLRLVLVGKAPIPELRDAATPDDTVTGYVPSATPFLDEAALMALPIRIGGGMRVKLLEALAAGKAVVASPLAASGLGVTDGNELVLADTDEQFADAIVTLASDAERRRELAGAAREWAQSNLSWDSRVSAYERLYRSLLESRTRA